MEKRQFVFLGIMLLVSFFSYAKDVDSIKSIDTKPLYKFSINMFDKLQKNKNSKNFVCSPFGVASLYRILGDGTDGITQKEIDEIIGVKSQDMAVLMNFINSEKNNSYFTINSANQIVLNQNYNLKDDYKKVVENNYHAMVELMDFKDSSTVTNINDWCSKKTQGMIPSVIDSVDPMTLLVALNSIYIKGEWDDVFEEKYTKKRKFKLLSGKKIPLDIMKMDKVGLLYGENYLFRLLKLDYKKKFGIDRSYSMLLLLPEGNHKLGEITNYLKNHSLEEIVEETREILRQPNTIHHVHVKLPKFTITTETNILNVMNSLGVTHLSAPKADFSKMTDEKVGINQSIQKAKIIVNEKGTEAASVTQASVVIAYGIGPRKEPEVIHHYFYATKPFIYLVFNEETNTILFMGQYTGED